MNTLSMVQLFNEMTNNEYLINGSFSSKSFYHTKLGYKNNYIESQQLWKTERIGKFYM